jgi:CBS domain-containing protein
MAERRVSCVVITEENGYGGFYPLGIVTERDIVQFQTLRLNLAQTLAQTVMSTPLFLLHPQDSLWKAHREMQRRRVRRLVVFWDLGRGLGIITQSNLMRVFDPVEMYGVIEILQRTIEQLEAEKAELLQSHNAEFEPHMPYRPAQLNQQAD